MAIPMNGNKNSFNDKYEKGHAGEMNNDPVAEQLELFTESPFALRLKFTEGLRIFNENYWSHLPAGKKARSVLRTLSNFFRDHYLDTPSKTDVERLRRHLSEVGYSVSTINKVHMTGSRLYSWWAEAKEGKFINRNDVSKVQIPLKNPFASVRRGNEKPSARSRTHEPLTKSQVYRLVECCDEELKDHILGHFWTLLRPTDFYRFTASNVVFKETDFGGVKAAGYIEGIQNKTITTRNPNGVPYRIPFFPGFEQILKRRIDSIKPGAPLFNKMNLQKRYDKARKLAGLHWVQMGRDLRTAGATWLLDRGVDPYSVAALLGHTSLEMLPRYTPRTDKHLIAAAEKLVTIEK